MKSAARVVRLVHWNAAEAKERAASLEAAGYIVDARELGLAAGLVDYKICAIDEDWSALKFVRHRTATR